MALGVGSDICHWNDDRPVAGSSSGASHCTSAYSNLVHASGCQFRRCMNFVSKQRVMPIALGAIVALVSLVVIAIPFIRGSGAVLSARHTGEVERLTRLRSDLYGQIGQLQTDYGANTVTDEDYQHQLLELRIGAAETIRLLDQLGYEDEPQDAPTALKREVLEEEIAALRQAGSVRNTGTDGESESDGA